MSPALLYAVPVLEGHEGPLEAALDDVPDAAFEALGGGRHALFVGAGEVCILLDSVEDPRAVADAFSRPEAEPLLRALAEHTAFDPGAARRYATVDVRHASDVARAAPNAAGATGTG